MKFSFNEPDIIPLVFLFKKNHKIHAQSKVPKVLTEFVVQSLRKVADELESGDIPIRIREKKVP